MSLLFAKIRVLFNYSKHVLSVPQKAEIGADPGLKNRVGAEFRLFWYRDSSAGLAERWRYFRFAAMIM